MYRYRSLFDWLAMLWRPRYLRVCERLSSELTEDMSAKPQFLALFFAFSLLHAFSWASASESLGNLAQYPPERIELTITTADKGRPQLQPEELTLNSGQYYRLTLDCPDVRDDLAGWRIEMPEFLNNAHLRLVTVGDIEVHLQGLSFNAIECDEIGSAHVSFVPIKPGVYPLYVGNVPLAVGRPIGESGVQVEGNFVFGEIVVR